MEPDGEIVTVAHPLVLEIYLLLNFQDGLAMPGTC